MSSVESDFKKILQIKKEIHTAIKNKGVDISNDTYFENYPTEIGKISGGSDNTILKTISTVSNPNVGMCVFSTPTTVLAEESASFISTDFQGSPALGIDYYGMNILPYKGYTDREQSIFKIRHNPFTIEKTSFSYPMSSAGHFRYFNNIIFYNLPNSSLRFDAGNIKRYSYAYLGDENFFYNASDKTVVRVDLDTGKVLDRYTCDVDLHLYSTTIMNNSILYSSSQYYNYMLRVNESTKSLDRIGDFPINNVSFRGFTNDKKFLIGTNNELYIFDVQDPTSPTRIAAEYILPSEFINFTTYASDLRFNFNPQNNILLAFSISDPSRANIKACKYINGTWIDYPIDYTINVSSDYFILQEGDSYSLCDCAISGNENILIMVVKPVKYSERFLIAINLKTNQYWLSAESPATGFNQYSVTGNIKSINEDNTLSVETLKIPVIKATITANTNNANITVYGEV